MMDIKGEMEMLMFKLNLEIYRYIYYNKESNVLEFKVNNEVFGMISEVETRILQLFDIKNDVYVCELDLDVLYKERKNGNIYSPVSKFPTVKRDLALIVNNDVHYSDISELLKKFGGKTLKEISLFDIYSDEKIGTNKKSIAVSLEFQSEEKTMTDDEVNNQVEKLIKNLKKELNIELRS